VSANGLYHDILACRAPRCLDAVRRTSSGRGGDLVEHRAETLCFFGVAREAEKVILTMSRLTVSIIFLAFGLLLAIPVES
jgi:hypothetical protein